MSIFSRHPTPDKALDCFQWRRLWRRGEDVYVLPDESDRGLGVGKIAAEDGRFVDGSPRPVAVATVQGKTVRARAVPAWDNGTRMRRFGPRPSAKVAADADKQIASRKTPVEVVRRRGYTFVVPMGARINALEPGREIVWSNERHTRILSPLRPSQIEALEYAQQLERRGRTPAQRAEILRDRGALFIVNHSGGKDSQAMYLWLKRELQVPSSQIRVVHADLPDADWPGTLEHIEATVDEDVQVVVSKYGSGDVKTLLSYAEKRGKFPSPAQRWCTSDLKTRPIDAWMTAEMCKINRLPARCNVSKARHRVVVMCLGMRAQESDNREFLEPWSLDLSQSVSGRIVFDYLPIFTLSDRQVFDKIKAHRQAPFWIYGRTPEHKKMLAAAGSVDHTGAAVPMTRMSCVYCIMGSDADIGVASHIEPRDLAEQYCQIEDRTGFTFRAKESLRDVIARGREKVRAGTKTRKRLPVVTAKRRPRTGPCGAGDD